ncbi:MAG: hypothetical protein ABEJ06_05440 [Haloarculaceae archaeon]
MAGSPPDGDRALVDAERLVVWVLAALVVAAVAGEAFVLADGGLAAERPQARFECDYDADAALLTVTHFRGDHVTDAGTRALLVHARDADAGNRANLTWAANGTGFTVAAGDRFRLDDPSVDSNGDGNYFDGDATVGWHFAPGDSVEVQWVGDDGARATLGRCTVGNATTG